MKIIRAKVLGYCMGVRKACEAVEDALNQSKNQKNVSVLQYSFINQKNDAPFILAFEKLKG